MSATAFYLVHYERQDGSSIVHAHHHITAISNYALCGLLTTITTLQPVEQIPIEERVMEDMVQFYQDNEGISCFRIEEPLGDILHEWLGRKDIYICQSCLSSIRKRVKERYQELVSCGKKKTEEVKMDTGPYTAVDVPRVGLPDDTIFGVVVFPIQDKGLHYTEDIIPYFLNRNPWQGGFITMGRTLEEAIQQLLDGKDSDEEREEMVQALREGRVRIFELTSRQYTFSIKETKKYTVEATRVFA